MASDFSSLTASIVDLQSKVTAATTTDAGATAFINGSAAQMKKAVTDALTADDAADQGSIQVATAAIDAVAQAQLASSKALGDAIVANTPAAPPAPAA